MKVWLDECLDHALRHLLAPHEVMTVAYLCWASLKNGELPRTAEENGVDVFLTGDGTLNCEQNLTKCRPWIFSGGGLGILQPQEAV